MRGERVVTLRIKKVWLDRIASKEKSVEYRKFSTFYEKLFREKFDVLALHYQTTRRLEVRVKRVDLVELEGAKFFAIELGEILLDRA